MAAPVCCSACFNVLDLIGETWFSNNTNDLNHSRPESQLLDCKWRAPHQARSLFESPQSLFGHGHRMGARINRGY
jgi:hypothetical protein